MKKRQIINLKSKKTNKQLLVICFISAHFYHSFKFWFLLNEFHERSEGENRSVFNSFGTPTLIS